MKPLSRRAFARVIIAASPFVNLLATGLVTAACADEDGEDKAQQYYRDAVGLMSRGHWLERCIRKLIVSVSESPGNAQYLVALGCAYACRSASIARGYIHRGDRVYSPDEVEAAVRKLREQAAAWRASQSSEPPLEDTGGDTNPSPPVKEISFLTQDDGQRLSLSRDHLESLVNAYWQNAMDSWGKAVANAGSPAELLPMQTTITWGMRLVTIAAQALADEGFVDDAKLQDWKDQAVQSAHRVIDLAPDAASGYLLLGETLLNPNGFKWLHIDKSVVPVYEKAASLAPGDASVNFRVYQVLDSIQAGDGGAYLRKAATCQRSNAYLHFCLAGFLMERSAPHSGAPAMADPQSQIPDSVAAEVLAIVDRGIAAPNFIPLASCIKPDHLLSGAYQEIDDEAEGKSYLAPEIMSLGRTMTDFARKTQQEDRDRSIRFCLAALRVADRIDEFISSQNSFDTKIGLLDMTVGSVRSHAYKALLDIYKNGSYDDDYQRVLAEQKIFTAARLAKARQGIARSMSTQE